MNAALVFLITSTDTIFQYVCDWQYKTKKHGAASQNGFTAENHALFFMMLNRRTLGHQSFKIIDRSLFTKAGAAPKSKKLSFNVRASNQKQKPLYYVGFCEAFIICGSPDWGGCQPDCDYENCAGGDDCYLENHCTVTWINPWSSGGSGGSGGDGGSGGGGGSSGGGGGNEPPDCSDPANKHAEGCEDGWEPIPVIPCPVTKEDIKAAFPLADTSKCRLIADLMNTYGQTFGIDTKEEIQVFLGQCAHETTNFKKMLKREDLYYTTPKQIVKTWPKRFKLLDTVGFANANNYIKDSFKLGEKVYSRRMGNTQPGYGFKFSRYWACY